MEERRRDEEEVMRGSRMNISERGPSDSQEAVIPEEQTLPLVTRAGADHYSPQF